MKVRFTPGGLDESTFLSHGATGSACSTAWLSIGWHSSIRAGVDGGARTDANGAQTRIKLWAANHCFIIIAVVDAGLSWPWGWTARDVRLGERFAHLRGKLHHVIPNSKMLCSYYLVQIHETCLHFFLIYFRYQLASLYQTKMTSGHYASKNGSMSRVWRMF